MRFYSYYAHEMILSDSLLLYTVWSAVFFVNCLYATMRIVRNN